MERRYFHGLGSLGKSRGQGLRARSHGLLLFVLGFIDGVPWQHQLLDHSVRRTLWGEAVFLKEEKAR